MVDKGIHSFNRISENILTMCALNHNICDRTDAISCCHNPV